MGDQGFPLLLLNIIIFNDDLIYGILLLISLWSQDIGRQWRPLYWTLRQLSRRGIVVYQLSIEKLFKVGLFLQADLYEKKNHKTVHKVKKTALTRRCQD